MRRISLYSGFKFYPFLISSLLLTTARNKSTPDFLLRGIWRTFFRRGGWYFFASAVKYRELFQTCCFMRFQDGKIHHPYRTRDPDGPFQRRYRPDHAEAVPQTDRALRLRAVRILRLALSGRRLRKS